MVEGWRGNRFHVGRLFESGRLGLWPLVFVVSFHYILG